MQFGESNRLRGGGDQNRIVAQFSTPKTPSILKNVSYGKMDLFHDIVAPKETQKFFGYFLKYLLAKCNKNWV